MKRAIGICLACSPLLGMAAAVTPPEGASSSYASEPAAVVWRAKAPSAAETPIAVDAMTKTVSITPNVSALVTSRPAFFIIIR